MENRINIGSLDTLVTVKSCEITTGSQGEKKFTFSTFRDVYANVDLNVSELVSNTNLEEGKYIQLTIHKIPELNTRWQVGISGKLYEVLSIDTVSRVSPVCVVSIKSFD